MTVSTKFCPNCGNELDSAWGDCATCKQHARNDYIEQRKLARKKFDDSLYKPKFATGKSRIEQKAHRGPKAPGEKADERKEWIEALAEGIAEALTQSDIDADVTGILYDPSTDRASATIRLPGYVLTINEADWHENKDIV